MKRIPVISFVLFALSACSGNDAESQLASTASRRSSHIEITGRISDGLSRTSLDEDGLAVLWSEGDSIGLFTTSAKNCGLALDVSSIGKRDGLFAGNIAGTPEYAYYPYSAGAMKTESSVGLVLPRGQVQKGNVPDMAYDVKVGRYVSGDNDKGYLFDFTQKLVMLYFVITPDSSIAGDILKSVSLSDAGRKLAGEYTLDLANPAASLSFSDNASDEVLLTFAEEPVLVSGTPVEGWMFVNADVASGDALKMTVLTDKHIVCVNVSASKQYQMGYRYRMPLDIAKLVSDGNAVVSANISEGDITLLSDPGVYDCAAQAYKCLYYAGLNQYVTSTVSGSTLFRVQNMHDGYSVSIALPSTAAEGGVSNVTVKSYGLPSVTSGTFEVNVVKVTSDKVWLLDPVTGTAYIMIKE